MILDEYGRLQPDPKRFPSSTQEAGFKKLAAYAHSKGLLFGIHTSRHPRNTAQHSTAQQTTHPVSDIATL